MGLKFYYGKKVIIVDTNGKSFVGTVNDYLFDDDNESGKESIVIDTPGGESIEFTEENIKSIDTV